MNGTPKRKPRGSDTRAVDVFDVRVGSEDLVVVSMPSGPRMPLPELTQAEREVATAALAGDSNTTIGRRRGRSPRTIANQLASVYRKLGVSSRAELAALLSREDEL